MASRFASVRLAAALWVCGVYAWADDAPPVPLTAFGAGSVQPAQSGLTPTSQKSGTFAGPDAGAVDVSAPDGAPAAAAPAFISGPTDPTTGGVPFTDDFGHTIANLQPGTMVNKLNGRCGTDGYCKVRVPDLQYDMEDSAGNVSTKGYEGYVPAVNVGRTMPSIQTPTGNSLREQFVKNLMGFRGTMYCKGGSSHRCTDCSGLTEAAALETGIRLPRTAALQQAASTRISEPQIGDLGFIGYPAHHVVAYIGNGQVIQAPQTGDWVRVTGADLRSYKWGDILDSAPGLKH